MATNTPLQETILIVDDNKPARDLIAQYLKLTDYKIITAANGQQALQTMQTHPTDLVILDILMPGMNGYEVLQHMRETRALRDIPVVITSAVGEIHSVVRSLELGAEDYLYKPINRSLLLARVQNTLEKQRLRRDHLRTLEDANSLKDQFVRTISHEMKNPLALISGYVELLIEDNVVPEGQPQDFLISIRKYANQMHTLVQDLLDLSKIHMTLSLEQADINALLTTCVDDLRLLAEQKNINIHIDIAPDPIICQVDALRIERVFNNLISNAIKYTPENGQIEIRNTLANNDANSPAVIIAISDNGLGIPTEDQAYIFDSFYRVATPDHQRVEGTGLGLAIARAIVEQHGGDIWVDSTLGAGSTFTLTIPKMLPEKTTH